MHPAILEWHLCAGQELGALGGVADLLPALEGPADSQPGSHKQQDRWADLSNLSEYIWHLSSPCKCCAS